MLTEKTVTLKLQPAIRVSSGTSVRQVIETVQRSRDGAVLVYDGDQLIGIMTERDVLMKVLARDVRYDDPVDHFMTPSPRTMHKDGTIGEAIALMMDQGFRNVPIVDSDTGEAVGLCRVQDIIHHLAESFPEHVLNLPPSPHQRMKTQDGA